jgi:hypothetical protein
MEDHGKVLRQVLRCLAVCVLAFLTWATPLLAITLRAAPTAGRAASDRWKVYRNQASRYRIKYPAAILPKEHASCPGIDGELSYGTRFDLADTTGFKAQVGLTVAAAPCTALRKSGLEPSVESVRLNGRLFTRRILDEGAAGTGYHSIEYTTVANDSCYAVVLTLSLGTALNWDEPDRSRIERSQNHGVKKAKLRFAKMIASFRTLR